MVRKATWMAWMSGLALCAAATASLAVDQFVPLLSYRVGAYAAGGSGIFGGYIDYMNYVNMKQGGVNGVKLVWEECETEYNNSRGVECYERLKKSGATGASLVQPVSTGITYSLMDRVPADKVPLVTIGYGSANTADGRVFPWVFPAITTYWSQASSQIKFIGQKLGGMDKLKGKKIALIYHDSAFGKEPIPVFEEYAKQYGFEFMKIAVPHPGNEQQSQWLQIRQAKPDYVLLWGWGVMNPTALKAAAKIGYPRDHIVGVWWSASEEDVIPAGDAAKGYIAGAFNAAGPSLPLVQDIKKTVYGAGKGNLEDQSRIGSVYHVRGIVHGILTVEAIRTAQEHFGKGKAMTGEQIRWGLEHLNLDDAKIKQLNAVGLIPAFRMSCSDHEGAGLAKFTQWDGSQWKTITDWIPSDKDMIRKMVEDSSMKYAKEKNITPRDCGKEG
jgi:branched-chain amino acid transport system substrate-binding protein